jgi:L-amino acid N-acyltransferase YncA
MIFVSMNQLSFQKAQENDLAAILEIYNFYIATTTATFDIGPIAESELCQRIFFDHAKYQTYLVHHGGDIAGFCFLTQFKKKKAYDRTAEIGIYLKPDFTGQGIGKKTVAFLEQIAVKKQIKVLVASISGENTASIKLFQRLGYERCAYYKQVGEKFGRILDVVDYQKVLE